MQQSLTATTIVTFLIASDSEKKYMNLKTKIKNFFIHLENHGIRRELRPRHLEITGFRLYFENRLFRSTINNRITNNRTMLYESEERVTVQ